MTVKNFDKVEMFVDEEWPATQTISLSTSGLPALGLPDLVIRGVPPLFTHAAAHLLHCTAEYMLSRKGTRNEVHLDSILRWQDDCLVWFYEERIPIGPHDQERLWVVCGETRDEEPEDDLEDEDDEVAEGDDEARDDLNEEERVRLGAPGGEASPSTRAVGEKS